MHTAHQGGTTSSKAIFENPNYIHKKELAGNALTIQSSYTYTSSTKEAQQALKLFLKINPCIHKKELAGNALTIQSSYTYTSTTEEAQQALKLFLKIHTCIHKKDLAGNALNIQSSCNSYNKVS